MTVPSVDKRDSHGCHIQYGPDTVIYVRSLQTCIVTHGTGHIQMWSVIHCAPTQMPFQLKCRCILIISPSHTCRFSLGVRAPSYGSSGTPALRQTFGTPRSNRGRQCIHGRGTYRAVLRCGQGICSCIWKDGAQEHSPSAPAGASCRWFRRGRCSVLQSLAAFGGLARLWVLRVAPGLAWRAPWQPGGSLDGLH